MTLQVESPTVYTSQGVPISVTGIAQVKIQGQNAEMLLSACEQFLGKSEQEIQHIALVTLEGHQRAIMGSMTVEEIYKDRKIFSKKVKRDARIGEAEAQAEAKIKEAMAEEQRMASNGKNETANQGGTNADHGSRAHSGDFCAEVGGAAKREGVRGYCAQAEAFAIKAKAVADAEQMSKKAEAWKEYGNAAMADMMLDTLPKIAAEVAAPLSQARKVTMVSCGDSQVGAAKLTGEVLTIMKWIPEMVKGVTGVDISKRVFRNFELNKKKNIPLKITFMSVDLKQFSLNMANKK
ncbi:putative flotillin [Operophtera brumata]|uniref:Putative flotillin n=1 Tax=Operophtera brumata TaxID=104452 RepID=A0A0L7KZY5_OPEBR|nr:putative flotillin [Operophtera brumata]